MTVKDTVIRETSINKVEVVGILVEKNLEERLYTNYQTGEIIMKIVGTISVQTGENEVHHVRLFFDKFAKTVKEIRMSEEFNLINQLVTVADTINNPEMVADFITVNGKLTQVENQKLKIIGLKFGRVAINEDYNPRATFISNVSIERVLEELSSEGDINIKAVMLNTQNKIPFTFLLPQDCSVFFTEYDVINKEMKLGGNIFSNLINNEYNPKLYVNFGSFI